MTLEHILNRGNNNFDLLRLIAALLVIVGHSYAIAPQPPHQDLILRLLGFDYSGSLAVKFFFFLSGLLVTNSIVKRSSILEFCLNRALRIYPGLFVCLLFIILVFGLYFTELPSIDYLRGSSTWSYLFRNMALINIQWKIPSVLDGAKYGLNGSLWTLPFEIRCYLYLMVLSALGVFTARWLANVVLCFFILTPFIEPTWIPSFGQNAEAQLLPACFAMGALLSVNKSFIKMNWEKAAGLWLLVVLISAPAAHQFLFYWALFYSSLLFASHEKVVKYLKLPFDASYGVYIYGFPTQQAVFALFPMAGVYGNQVISAGIALLLGIGSWYIVERPSMLLGKKFIRSKFETVKVSGNLAQ